MAAVTACRRPSVILKITVNNVVKRIPIYPHPPKPPPPPKDAPPKRPTFCPKEHRKHIVEMVRQHACQHPFIPVDHTTRMFLEPEEIHYAAVRDMYTYCKERDLSQVWAYLWNNWYRPDKWVLWARSACADLISVLRTTMIVEGFWNKLKHLILVGFHNPRLDLIVYLIITQIIPAVRLRLDYHLERRRPGRNKALASWQEDFLKLWFDMARTDAERRSLKEAAIMRRQNKSATWRQEQLELIREDQEREAGQYHTDLERWLCSCPSFLRSRFLMCKHVVRLAIAAGAQLTRRDFYELRRHREPPFFHIPHIHANITMPPNGPVQERSHDRLQGSFDDASDEDGDGLLNIPSPTMHLAMIARADPADPAILNPAHDVDMMAMIMDSGVIDGAGKVRLEINIISNNSSLTMTHILSGTVASRLHSEPETDV